MDEVPEAGLHQVDESSDGSQSPISEVDTVDQVSAESAGPLKTKPSHTVSVAPRDTVPVHLEEGDHADADKTWDYFNRELPELGHLTDDLQTFGCTDCGVLLMSLDALKRHSRSKHGTFIGGDYLHCTFCSFSSHIRSTINSHMVMCRNNPSNLNTRCIDFMCQICGKLFTSAGNVRMHQTVHTGQKDFKCDICGKLFTRAGNVRIHRKVHTGSSRNINI